MPPQVDVINRDDYYSNIAYTVAIGASDVELDIEAALKVLGRHPLKSECKYLHLITDVAITVKLNKTTFGAITIAAGATGRVFDRVILLKKIFFSLAAAGCPATDATVQILAF